MIDPSDPDYANTPVADRRPSFGYAPTDPQAPAAVTIITPFYNTDSVFYETARSVLQQSLQQWEWLIINDGSTDAKALAILDRYRRLDPRIRVIDHEQNKGLSAARNSGYGVARTDYVLQIDSDDLSEPTAAEKWLWFLLSYPEYAFVSSYMVGFGAQEFTVKKDFAYGPAFLEANYGNGQCMIRRSVQQSVGGYDENIRDGLEDWEFWLRCANAGYWGATVPEYLVWHRRRPDHDARWQNTRSKARIHAFRDQVLRQRYPRLWAKDGFPQIVPKAHGAYAEVPDVLPCINTLYKEKPRLLLLVRCLTMGGGSAFDLDVVEQLTRRGWEITIAATDEDAHPWLPYFARYTPDIFILPHFLRLTDYPRFLRYLIASRQIDTVFLTSSEAGYLLLPYLRAHFPSLPIVDYCHIVNEERNNGGFPRLAVQYQALLDVNGVSSHSVKEWMVAKGAEADRIVVQHTNVDTALWCPHPGRRAQVRAELGIADDCPVIAFVGRLVPPKQPMVVVKTAHRLKHMGHRFVMLVVGEGQDLPAMRTYVRQHKLADCMRLLGAVSRDRVRELMTAGDIFFLPSHNEGISLAIFEAMACGLAVVAADVGGQRELVTPDCGILVPHVADSERYAAVLGDLLSDPKRWRAMGMAGRERVMNHFRLENMSDGLLSMFRMAERRRRTITQPEISLGIGQASAAQAVEYLRLALTCGQQVTLSAQRRLMVHRRPRTIGRFIQRLVTWGVSPTGPLVPIVRAGKRLLPLPLKIALKRRFMG